MGQTSFFGRANALDLALAAFAAGAFGFAAFAMPEWRLNQLVLGSGLAEVFAPARPPLGLKATLGIATLAAALAFAGSLASLVLAGKAGPRRRAATEADAAPEPIRLRRADAHPDAPMRRPLVAGRDLGEPPREELLLGAEARDPHPEATHSFLVRQEPETVDMEPVTEGDGEDDLEPLIWEPVLARSSVREAVPQAAPEPQPEAAPGEELEPEPGPEPVAEPQTELESEPEPQAESEPEPEPVAGLRGTIEPVTRHGSGAAPAPASESSSVPESIDAPTAALATRHPSLPEFLGNGPAPEASISTLMQRLEFGLSRKERSAPLDPAAVAAPRDEAVGHRLRSAINDLQKLGARS
jgi:hypothetical protein